MIASEDKTESSGQSGNQLVFLWNTHKYIDDYIKFADTKAAFVVAILSAFLSSGIKSGSYATILHKPVSQWCLLDGIAITALILMLAAVLMSVNVIRPRLKTKQVEGIIYWKAITIAGCFKFVSTIESLDDDTLRSAVAGHTYEIAEIATKKYRFVALAMILGIVGALAAGLVALCR